MANRTTRTKAEREAARKGRRATPAAVKIAQEILPDYLQAGGALGPDFRKLPLNDQKIIMMAFGPNATDQNKLFARKKIAQMIGIRGDGKPDQVDLNRASNDPKITKFKERKNLRLNAQIDRAKKDLQTKLSSKRNDAIVRRFEKNDNYGPKADVRKRAEALAKSFEIGDEARKNSGTYKAPEDPVKEPLRGRNPIVDITDRNGKKRSVLRGHVRSPSEAIDFDNSRNALMRDLHGKPQKKAPSVGKEAPTKDALKLLDVPGEAAPVVETPSKAGSVVGKVVEESAEDLSKVKVAGVAEAGAGKGKGALLKIGLIGALAAGTALAVGQSRKVNRKKEDATLEYNRLRGNSVSQMLKRQREAQAAQINEQRLQMMDPHLYTELLAGRKLAPEDIYLGDQRRDLVDDVVQSMSQPNNYGNTNGY